MLCCVVLCMPRQQVRSCTLDTKVWEPAVVGLFQHIGNEFANRVWEGGAAPGGGGGGGGPATSGKVGRAAGLAGCRTRLHVCRLGVSAGWHLAGARSAADRCCSLGFWRARAAAI